MTVDLRFVRLEVADETRALLEEQITSQFREFQKLRPFKVSVVCSTEAARQDAHGPMFRCHASFQAPWLTKDIHVEEKGVDGMRLISACCHTLKSQVLKHSKRIKSKRYKPLVRTLEQAVS